MESAVKDLFEKGAPTVIVTLGEDGCVGMSSAGFFRQEAFKVNALDTTGAGDVFHGAFCYGLAQGWELKRVVEFSAAAAALKCRKIGGRAGIPTKSEVEKVIVSHTQN